MARRQAERDRRRAAERERRAAAAVTPEEKMCAAFDAARSAFSEADRLEDPGAGVLRKKFTRDLDEWADMAESLVRRTGAKRQQTPLAPGDGPHT